MNTIIIGLSMLFTFTAAEKTIIQGEDKTVELNRGETVVLNPSKHYFITTIDGENNVRMLEKRENNFIINELF